MVGSSGGDCRLHPKHCFSRLVEIGYPLRSRPRGTSSGQSRSPWTTSNSGGKSEKHRLQEPGPACPAARALSLDLHALPPTLEIGPSSPLPWGVPLALPPAPRSHSATEIFRPAPAPPTPPPSPRTRRTPSRRPRIGPSDRTATRP